MEENFQLFCRLQTFMIFFFFLTKKTTILRIERTVRENRKVQTCKKQAKL
jgi:hypothetical protein